MWDDVASSATCRLAAQPPASPTPRRVTAPHHTIPENEPGGAKSVERLCRHCDRAAAAAASRAAVHALGGPLGPLAVVGLHFDFDRVKGVCYAHTDRAR